MDPKAREALIKQVGDAVRKDLVWLPLFQKPLVTAWRGDKLEGPVGLYTSSSYSGFYNIDQWSLKNPPAA